MDNNNSSSEIFEDIFFQFKSSWAFALRIYDFSALFLMTLGFFGGALALAVMGYSKRMQTPSFVYHRALIRDG